MNVVRVSRRCCEPAGGERSTQLCSSANATTSNFLYIRSWSHSTFPRLFCIASTIPTNGVGKKCSSCRHLRQHLSNKVKFSKSWTWSGDQRHFGRIKKLVNLKDIEAMSSKWKYCCESDSTVAGGGLACGVPGCAVHRRLTASTNYKLPKHCTPPSQVHCGHYRLC